MSKGRKGHKGTRNCHFDPFGKAQDKLREKSFLDPSYWLGMPGLDSSLGVLGALIGLTISPNMPG